VGEIAAERGEDPFATIVEIVANDRLRTVLWPIAQHDDDADWERRRELWSLDDIVALVEAREQAPKKRGPYKKRAAQLAISN